MNQSEPNAQKYKLLIVIVLLILAVFGQHSYYALNHVHAADEPAVDLNNQAPSLTVEVAELKVETIRLWEEFSGRLQAVDRVEIKPKVGGHIQQVLFEDGAYVKKGDLLFVIDPRPYQVEIDRIKGELDSVISKSKLADIELERAEGLYLDKMVPRREVDNRKNDRLVAHASIEMVKAELQQARLNLEYAKIEAPISGRISRAEFTEGNLIETMMGAPVLTTIVSTGELYAEFDIDEQTYVRMVRKADMAKRIPVEMSLPADKGIVYEGEMHSFDNQLNVSSGTIRARALFSNKDGVLIPGMFVHVRMGAPDEDSNFMLTEKAIGTDQDKKFIYVLNENNEVQYSEVRLGKRIHGKRIIYSDLPQGTRVIINNIHLIRPGMVVKPINPKHSDTSVS